MQQQSFRFTLALIYLGATLLLPLLLPISAVFQILMNQLVSVVWADLHPKMYATLQLIVVYGLSAAAVTMFMIKLRISKRLQPHYASARLWLVGCALFFIVFVVNILVAADIVSFLPSDKQLLGYMILAAKIILLVASVRVLIGVLPRANKAIGDVK
jgi:glucan phosphoethanolaminetransferase (alkaline phosphatase superfamily)